MLLDFRVSEVSIREEELTVNSEILNREVECVLYLPDMDGVVEPLHLLLINDGQDLQTMQYEKILRTLYKKNRINPILTVGIKAGNRLQEFGISGTPDYKGRGSEAEKYRQFVVDELLPAIYEKTNITEFASSSIIGFSLGAVSAFDIAWNHSDIFSKVGAFSGAFWWRSKEARKEAPDNHRIVHKLIQASQEKPELKFWFEAGTQDEKSDRNQNGIIDSIDDTTSLIHELYKKGYERNKDTRYMEIIGGRHDVATWARLMPCFLLWAFAK
ncbi:alpha/beta hydrolase [Rufibacter latericius]|uniref:Esterase family protein n=1 Tax=Rufibacter latericius TaxID=2487040 RepID=A0A3M9MBQ9_9BACT|nr:alpha/beta hydrolase-fold protein [Rufibacter latericius]RNI23020.1 esterase family protein [Rufibacter latericius]